MCFVLFDILSMFIFDETFSLQLSPYVGITLQGVVRATIVRGRLVYREGLFCPEPVGKHLLIAQRKHNPSYEQ